MEYTVKIFDNLHRNSMKCTSITKNPSVEFVQGIEKTYKWFSESYEEKN